MSADPFAELKASAMADTAQPADPFADLKASAQAEATPTKPTAQSQIKDAMAGIKNGFPTITGAIKKGIDWLGQLGQPQAARDYAQKVTQSPDLPRAPGPSLPPGFGGEVGAAPPSGPVAHAVAGGVVNAATQPMTYGPAILDAAKAIPWLRGVAGVLPNATANITSKLTKISPEALLTASTPEGRAALANSAQSIEGSGSGFAKDVANVMNMPEKARVDAAAAGFNGSIDRNGLYNAILSEQKKLPAGVEDPDLGLANERIQKEADAYLGKPPDRMSDADFQNKIKDLEAQESGTSDFQASNKIQRQIEDLKAIHAANPPLDPKISASDALILQRNLGTKANYLDPMAGPLNNARKAGYDYLKTGMEDLANENNNPQFILDKKSMSDRFDLNSELEDMIGKEEGSRQDIKAANFVKGIWNKGPNGSFDDAAKIKQNLLARLDAKQGTNWLEQSKQMALSREFGPKGIPQWIPKNIPAALGEATAGGVGSAAMAHYGLPLTSEIMGGLTAATVAGSSPALAVRAINASRLPPWIIKKTLQNSPALSAAAAASQTNLPQWVR